MRVTPSARGSRSDRTLCNEREEARLAENNFSAQVRGLERSPHLPASSGKMYKRVRFKTLGCAWQTRQPPARSLVRCGFKRSYLVTTPRTCRLASVSVDTSAFRAGHMLAAACSFRGQHFDRKTLGHRLPGVPPTSRDDRRRISKHPSQLTFFRSCISQTPPMRRALVPTSARTRPHGALACRSTCRPATCTGPCRGRGFRRCRRPELGSWKGWRRKRFSGPSLFCFVACSGYLPALAQAALLETYGGPNVAVEAASLTDAVRARCGTARLQPAPPARTPAALAVRADDAAPEHALGKRFLLTPRMLLTRPAELGGDGRRVLLM